MRKHSAYLDLIRALTLTDFKLKYQGSILGYLWTLVKPILMFLVLYLVFTKFFKIGASVPYYPVYLLLGIVLWMFFIEITSTSIDAIVSKGDLIRKVFFPRIVLVISRGTAALITFTLNFLVVLGFMIISSVKFQLLALFMPLLIIELFVLTTGIALMLSSLFVRYRDLSHIWEVFLQILFYATPIIYPLSFVPPKMAKLLMLNPIAQIIQDSRYVLITNQAHTAWQILPQEFIWIPYTLPIFIFGFGYFQFQRSAAKFAEEI
ncbi:MAG: ABC transporter permease [Paenibacillus sp.]|nr:ABC transporter permease [Paenibacillus sp.]